MPTYHAGILWPQEVPQRQADAVISQANPVSTTLYEVLALTRNVRVYSMAMRVTWAVTQPTPMDIVATIDGNSLIYTVANPVSASLYAAQVLEAYPENTQGSVAENTNTPYRSFLLEGHRVRVQVRVTWAVTQPTPLWCRVKYARW